MPQPTLTEYLADRECKGFAPVPHYIPATDNLIVFFGGEFALEEQVNDSLMVYRSAKTGEIVGCKIMGVTQIMEAHGYASPS